jgi:hypothetical protein
MLHGLDRRGLVVAIGAQLAVGGDFPTGAGVEARKEPAGRSGGLGMSRGNKD